VKCFGLSSQSMRVLHIGKFYPPYRGGMEAHLETLCQQLRGRVDVEVLTSNITSKTESCMVDGVRLTRVGRLASVASTPICPALVSHIRQSRMDLVHLHWPNPAAALALLASGYQGRLIVSYHSDVVRQRFLGKACAPILESLLRRCNAIIATSANYIASSPVLWKYSSLCRVIPLGVAEACFAAPQLESVTRIRQQYGEKLVLSVGRLVYYKGFEYLIRAMSSVSGQLLIAGQGPLREPLLKLRNDLGLQERVTFLGNPSDEYLRACYHAADVFVLASVARSEAFGLVQVEAMAAGTPVVNTNLPSGVPFVSRHGETGLTVELGNAEALSTAITVLLENDSLRRQYGAAARRRAESVFTVKVMLDKTLATYEHVLRGGRLDSNPEILTRSAVAAG
jgi:glycosyltransferase involved in cell wall biosynthesis